jgi:hypothetical protein
VARGLAQKRLEIASVLREDGAVVLRPTQAWPRAYVATSWQTAGAQDELSVLTGPGGGPVVRAGDVLDHGRKAAGADLGSTRMGDPIAAAPSFWSPTRMTFRAGAREPSLLVVSDAFAEGWHASVDGAEVPIHRANIVARAVALSPGQHDVQMWFDVPLFRWSVRLPSLGLALAFLALLLHLRRHRQVPDLRSAGAAK